MARNMAGNTSPTPTGDTEQWPMTAKGGSMKDATGQQSHSYQQAAAQQYEGDATTAGKHGPLIKNIALPQVNERKATRATEGQQSNDKAVAQTLRDGSPANTLAMDGSDLPVYALSQRMASKV